MLATHYCTGSDNRPVTVAVSIITVFIPFTGETLRPYDSLSGAGTPPPLAPGCCSGPDGADRLGVGADADHSSVGPASL